MVKNLPVIQETRVQSLGGEDPLEEEMATHPSILAWKIPWTRGAWWAIVHGLTESYIRVTEHSTNAVQPIATTLDTVSYIRRFQLALRISSLSSL